jgi:coenzyme F420 hydrogenase subunit beta
MRNNTIEDVINNKFCIGCGVCQAIDSSFEISMNKYGEYSASMNGVRSSSIDEASEVCPFSSTLNETDLANETFSNMNINEHVGSYDSLYAGFSYKDRNTGSSGGIITHLLKSMLEHDEIDYAVVVSQKNNQSIRGLEFSFKVVSSPEDLTSCSTSFYYPVTYAKILEFILDNPGRYAITGVPCFNKALRLLRRKNPIYDERIKYQFGLVCGQMKSSLYFEYLLRKSGANGAIDSANFRKKSDGRADEYYFEATTNKKKEIFQLSNRKIGINWGMGLFKPKACDYCDDIFAETADISVMDGWLPKYVGDGKGTSLVVVRNKDIGRIIKKELKDMKLSLESVNVDAIIESQQGGINHRRKGLSYRLFIAKGWLPIKRIHASNRHDVLYRIEQLFRIVLRKSSFFSMALQMRAGHGLALFNFIMAIPIFFYKIIQKIKKI